MSERKLITHIEYPGPNVAEGIAQQPTGHPYFGRLEPGQRVPVALGKDAQDQAHAVADAGLVKATYAEETAAAPAEMNPSRTAIPTPSPEPAATARRTVSRPTVTPEEKE